MASGSGGKRGGPRPGRPYNGRPQPAQRSGGKPKAARSAKPFSPAGPAAPAPAAAAESFTLGAIPGATPGKWIDIWAERMPHTRLELVPLTVADQREALTGGVVDAALVRLPMDKDDLHVIALYDEVTVVVFGADSHLAAADELDASDLEGEVLVVPADDALGLEIDGTVAPRFDPPETTADAIATVAAGVGIVVVPMSLARLYHRKDAEYRPLREAPTSRVALAWVAARTTPEVEAFVGIVRGRTANSSR